MSEQGTTTSETRARLVQVLDEYLAAVQEGRQPDRDELRARHPDLAEELQACLDSLDFIRRAAVEPGLAAPGEELAEAEVPRKTLGDYRIVREVGRVALEWLAHFDEQLTLRLSGLAR